MNKTKGIFVAATEGELHVKRLVRKNGKVRLKSENPA
ncbi:MAG: S24 family peptidase [Desulfovibrio sp.]|nr:S24 family peptidase [Desulfovibrio sp.]